MNKFHPGADLLNTKSSTYANRMWIKIMKSTIKGEPPIKFGTFHSDAITHKEIDDGRTGANDLIFSNLLAISGLSLKYTLVIKSGFLPSHGDKKGRPSE